MDLLSWEPDPADRIMIIAPHPDDEVLAAGGVIIRSSSQSGMRVIVATNGDASYATTLLHGSHLPSKKNFRRQAVMRQKESLNALASLGLQASHIHFLGFPDRGLTSLWRRSSDKIEPYRSKTTGYKKSVQAINSPIMTYTKASLEKLIGDEFLEFCPTTLIMPHPFDNHADHSTLACFILQAVRRYSQSHPTPRLFAYWMWHQEKPWLTGKHPADLASLHFELDSAAQHDLHLMLSPEIWAQKARALKCYPSQKISARKIFRETSRELYETFSPIHLLS